MIIIMLFFLKYLDIENYKPITLLNSTQKLYTYIHLCVFWCSCPLQSTLKLKYVRLYFLSLMVLFLNIDTWVLESLSAEVHMHHQLNIFNLISNHSVKIF